MKPQWQIRRANFSDENQILEIVAPLRTPAFNWSIDAFLSEFQQTQTLVLTEGAMILAFACFRDVGAAWEISVLATRKEFQGKGVMKELFGHIFNTYGHERELWLEVHENNLAARNLYQKLGFVAGALRRSYYSDGAAAILFTRSVPQSR